MIPITMTSVGETVKVARITGRDETKSHLRDLGFVENTPVTVIAKNGGNMILQVRETRVALDEKMATRIMV